MPSSPSPLPSSSQANAPQRTPWLDRRAWGALFIFLLLAGLLYLATLDTGLTAEELRGGDLITHQYAQVQARPSNAPGYPIYTMGGWLWFHAWRILLPHSNPVPILSSYSTLWALLALAVFFLILYRLTRGNLVISLGMSAFYAVTYFFWYYAVSTEQYASAVLQTLVIVALLIAWDEDGRDRWLYALAFVLGLGLAHMVTVLFIAPGVILFVLLKQPDLLKRWRLILISLLLALLPLVAYIYVYVRGAQHPEWWGVGNWENARQWFFSFVSTQQGRDEMTWSLFPFNIGFFKLIIKEITPLFVILGIVGWWRQKPRYRWFFWLTAVIYLLFVYIDRFGNWYQVIMPLYPLVLLGAASALAYLWHRFPNHLWRIVLTLVLIAMVVLKFSESYPRANLRHRPEDVGLAPGWEIINQAPPRGAAIIASTDEKLALDYLTQIWGERSDLAAISPTDAGQVLAQGRPLLVTSSAARYAAEASGLPLRYNAWGPTLLRADVEHLPELPLDGFSLVAAPLGDGLKLVGFQTFSRGDDSWWVRLALQAQEQPQHDWAISVRLLAQGQEIAQQDHSSPALGATPTSSLRPGEVVFDIFAFELPAETPPPDALRIIVYRQLEDGSFDNLAVLDFPLNQ